MPAKKNKGYVIKCQVSRGTFRGEFFIVIELPGGEVLTAVADESQVVFKGPKPQSKTEKTEAGLLVSVIERWKTNWLVDLHRETFSGGSRVVVPKDLVTSVA